MGGLAKGCRNVCSHERCEEWLAEHTTPHVGPASSHLWVAEDGTLWDLAKEKLHNCAELVHSQPETESLRGGRLALRLQQAAVRLGVLKL